MSAKILTDEALDLIFRNARTANGWTDAPVRDELLHEIYNIMKFGPTSANGSPLRIVFVKTEAAKEKLKPLLLPGNVDKVMTAPVTAIFANDQKFYDHLPKLFPHTDARAWYTGNDELIQSTAFRNGTLQAAYFMVTARALGLDCGPMSGFDAEGVNKAFFADTSFKVNFICALGHGDASKTFPRSPRFTFEEVCKII